MSTEPGTPDVQPHYDLQLRVLDALAEARNYNRWIADMTLPHLGEHPIEIGSGLGDLAALWLESGVDRVTLSDLEQRSIESLAGRFDNDPRVDLRQLDLTEGATGTYSAAVAVNVLEHVEDDLGALVALRALVRPGGRIIVFVPAMPFAMSQFDRAIGHYRRYKKAGLTDLFEAAGIRPTVARYVNAPGLFGWLVAMKLLRGEASKESRLIKLWDRTVIPVARRVEQRWQPPFGQSTLVIGEPDPGYQADQPPSTTTFEPVT